MTVRIRDISRRNHQLIRLAQIQTRAFNPALSQFVFALQVRRALQRDLHGPALGNFTDRKLDVFTPRALPDPKLLSLHEVLHLLEHRVNTLVPRAILFIHPPRLRRVFAPARITHAHERTHHDHHQHHPPDPRRAHPSPRAFSPHRASIVIPIRRRRTVPRAPFHPRTDRERHGTTRRDVFVHIVALSRATRRRDVV